MPDFVLGHGTRVKEKAGGVAKKEGLNSRQRDPHGHNSRNHAVLSENNKGTLWLG